MDNPFSALADPSLLYELPNPGSLSFEDMEFYSYAMDTLPALRIVEQPKDKFRFRYETEMSGTHGSLTGRSCQEKGSKTYPTVELLNFSRPAVIRCTLYQYQKDDQISSKIHPYSLQMKHSKKRVSDEPFCIKVSPDKGYEAMFHSMGIICVGKKHQKDNLVKKLKNLKKTDIGDGRNLSKSENDQIELEAKRVLKDGNLNLNKACLRFDALEFIGDTFVPICEPVFSEPINNLKSASTSELKIVRMSDCHSPASGDKEIFLLVEKVKKDDIKIRLFEQDVDGSEIWCDYGRFTTLDVHHQYAIVFKTPPYADENLDAVKNVYIQLERSDGTKSEPREFNYVPSRRKLGLKRTATTELLKTENPPSKCSKIIEDNSLQNYSELQTLLGEVDNEEDLLENAAGIDSLQHLFCFQPDQYEINVDFEVADHDPQFEIDSSLVLKSTEYDAPEYKTEKTVLEKLFRDLVNFFKTKPSLEISHGYLKNMFKKALHFNGSNILHLAVSCNEIQILYHILHELYKLEIVHYVNYLDGEGRTPLHLAVENKIDIAIYLLLKMGADLNVQDCSGNTALHLAIRTNKLPIVKQLCNHGANLNIKEFKSGWTGLHLAISENKQEIAEYLIETPNIDLFQEDFRGFVPLDIAKAMEATNCSQLLRDSMVGIVKEKYCVLNRQVEEYVDVQCLEIIYNDASKFEDKALDEICELLDKTGLSEELASYFNIERTNNCAKKFLQHLLQMEGLWDIREAFLNLEEYEAVDMMDKMVWKIFK